MSIRLTVRMAAPSIAISLVLLALGVGGGWYVHHLQKSTAALVALDMKTIRAAEQLVFAITEIHSELTDYLASDDRGHIEAAQQKRARAERALQETERLVDDPNEKALTKKVRDGYSAFGKQLDKLAEVRGDKATRAAVKELISVPLDRGVLKPARELLAMEEALIRKSGDYNQGLARWIALFLFLVGTCGAVAGLVAGFGIARGVSRSIVELYLQIRAASGRLEEVIGPVDVAPAAGIDNLDNILRLLADHVGSVVDRLQESQTKMLRTEQMAALGQLAAGLAHELRNPLTAMKMLIAAAAESDDPGHFTARDLAVLTAETARLERSIQAFLDFARPPKLEKQSRDLREAVRQTLDLVAARAKQQGVCLQSDLPARPVIVEADHEQIRQVLLNLVLNAMDAQLQGGTVKITVAETPQPTEISSARDHEDIERSSWVALAVTDKGPGIANGIAQRIFDPYVSTKETGLGLGLAICRRIVEDHGGTIVAANQPGGGAEFIVRLPAPDGRVGPASLRAPAHQLESGPR